MSSKPTDTVQPETNVSGYTSVISATPVISAASIYAAGDAVGGRMEFTNAARARAGTGVIMAMTVIDQDQELAALKLVLFNQSFTASPDNAAFDPTDAHNLFCIGVISVGVSDYHSFNDNAVAHLRNICLPYEVAAVGTSTSLWGQLVTGGTPTYTAVDDLTVKLHVLMD